MSDPSTPAGRLTLARIRAGYADPKSFWSRHGIPQATYSLHESGKRGLTQKAAQKYARLLGCSAAWLMLGDGEAPPVRPGPAPLASDQAAEAAWRYEQEAAFLLLYDRLAALAGENNEATEAELGVVFRPFGYEKGPRGIVRLAVRLWLEIAAEANDLTLPERALKKIADVDQALGSVKETLRQIERLAGR